MAASLPEGDTGLPNTIRVFSNPSVGAFSLMIQSVQSERISYSVYDDQGRRRSTGMVFPNTPFSFGSELRPGLYVFVADLQGERITMKLVKAATNSDS